MSSYQEVVQTLPEVTGTPPLQQVPVKSAKVVGSRRISNRTFQWIVTIVEVAADFLTSVAAVFMAHKVFQEFFPGQGSSESRSETALAAAAVGLIVTLLFERESAYRGSTSLLRIKETERALKVPCITLLLLFPLSILSGHIFPLGMLVCLVIFLPALLLFQKSLIFSSMCLLHGRGYGVQRVVIYGTGAAGRRLFTALSQSPKLGFHPVAILNDGPSPGSSPLYELGYSRRNAIDVQRVPFTRELVHSLHCDTLFIDVQSVLPEAIFAAIHIAGEEHLQVAFLHNQLPLDVHRTESFDLDGMLLTLNSGRGRLSLYSIVKRSADFAISFLLLVLLSPILTAIALTIHLDSPGPVLFWHDRIGKNGRRFSMAKFRSMHVCSPKYARSPTTTEDTRITAVGRFLRRTSFDELPQLINVLRGEMSLVGPRPEMPFLVQQYDAAQRQRLQVLPGITGLWQLSADRAFLIHENPEYDLYYIRNRGFFLDLAILMHTALFAARGM